MAPPEVRCYGIRHHGPGSARALLAALRLFAPDVVLIEAPLDAAGMLTRIGAAGLEPPVALLGYVADDPRRAAFAPFAAFSPEWAAAAWAHRHGVPVRPIDLAWAHTLALDASARAEGGAPVDPIAELAAAAGDPDPERWWEDVVEHRAAGDPFAALAEAMTSVRALTDAATGLEALREATMRQQLRAAARSGAVRIAVVAGAWHVPVLDGSLLPVPSAQQDAALLRGLPKVKVTVTWVPWTHRRLAAATGYGAGVAAPGWYAHVHRHPAPATVGRWFAQAAHVMRAREVPVSPEHVVAATRLADALATLRGRPAPGLDEVDDAALAVIAEGRPAALTVVRDGLVVGDAIGFVPDDVPTVPLARDLTAQARAVRLKPEGLERVLELDLREARDLGRSRLLHRLWLLQIPWGIPAEGRNSVGTFRETWRLRWEPELDLLVIDASGRGTTVAAAAASAVCERAVGAAVPELAALVEAALLAGLDDAVPALLDQLARRAAGDTDVEHLMDALVPMARAARYGDVRATAGDVLAGVVDALALRVCAGLAPACAGRDDDAAAALVDRIAATQAALALLDHPARRVQWPDALERVSASGAVHGLLRGAATRLLLDDGRWDTAAVGRRLAQALGPGTPAAVGAAFVEGFLSGSGTVLVHDATLLGLVDDWLCTLSADMFTNTLPLLRRTFSTFDPAERRRLGELVAGRGDGRPASPFGWDLDPGRAASAEATVRLLLGVPA
jgi:hypothetical protein